MKKEIENRAAVLKNANNMHVGHMICTGKAALVTVMFE